MVFAEEEARNTNRGQPHQPRVSTNGVGLDEQARLPAAAAAPHPPAICGRMCTSLSGPMGWNRASW
jgi:hypothetical protein